ncbi:molybdopterin-dependent oxidoreductase, partial [Candidatus Bipolaricaulota bacterium]|nr:molybdopterin-dependent oxidoreductase [Candidatus Bipolaricaulota bacterium]
MKVRAAQRAGATVVSLQGRLCDADIVIDDRDPRSIIEQLIEPAENKTGDGLTSLREHIALAKHPLLVIEERMISQETARTIIKLVRDKPSYKIVLLRGLANVSGLMRLGFRAGNKSSSDQLSTCFVFGANPGKDPIYASKLEQANLVVAMTHMRNETTNYADVVLPMSLPIECEGHLIDTDNRTRALSSDLSSPIHKENWEIIVELGSVLGLGWRYGEFQTVTKDTNSLLLSHSANESSGSIFAGTVSSLALAIEQKLSEVGI